MPQATNQRLVSQMAATPAGRGTVYNALLRARAGNRQRAAIVNTSERQRLEKIQRSIDKDLQHAEWRADQTINRIKGSLTKLLAYQKVLREDFPAKQLCSASNSGQVNNNNNNSNVRSSMGTNQWSGATGNIPDQLRELSQGSTIDDTTHGDKFHLRSINEVSAANKSFVSKCRDKTVEKSTPHLSEEKFHHSANDFKEKDLGFPKSQSSCLAEPRDRRHETRQSTRIRSRSSEGGDHIEPVITKPAPSSRVVHSKLLPLRERLDEYTDVQEETGGFNVNVLKGTSNDSELGKENLSKHGQPRLLQRNQKEKQQTNKQLQPSRVHVFDTSEETHMRGPLTDAQKLWHAKRIKRKETVTQQILTRGFDMRTLAWEIDRKLLVMDSGYARQRERRHLVQEGREDVARLVTRNQAEFPRKVLTSNKQQTHQSKMADCDADAEANTGLGTSTGDAREAGVPMEGDAGENDQARPVFETVTMLNPLLHKIPLSY